MRTLPLLLTGIILLGKPARAEKAAGAAEVRSLIETAINGTIDVLKDKANDREARRRKIYALMDPVVDWGLMGKLTLGPKHWGEFEADQRKEFIESFTRAFRDSIFDKVEVYTNETVEYNDPTPSDKGKLQMLVIVVSKGDRYKCVFKAYHPQTGWKVYDVEVEGISMVRTYASQYDQVLQKGGPKELLAKLKTKALAVPDDLRRMGQKQQGSAQK